MRVIRNLVQVGEVFFPMIIFCLTLSFQLLKSEPGRSVVPGECQEAFMEKATAMGPKIKHDSVYHLVPHQWMP